MEKGFESGLVLRHETHFSIPSQKYQSKMFVALLLLSTLLTSVSARYCQCLCNNYEFDSGYTSWQSCNDWCLDEIRIRGGSNAVCPRGRLQYTEVSDARIWWYIGSGIAAFVILVAVGVYFCCVRPRQQKANAAIVVMQPAQQPVAYAPSTYSQPTYPSPSNQPTYAYQPMQPYHT
ncbi:hypothetical protein BC830DRAFT_1100841 [Chytriomyces sp. MP71]|nr:hypothetical protein BC830DRAFT_1100841 [Chytriomyces sp. MP71]